MDVENVHSILNHGDKRGVQTSSVPELARHMSNLQRLQILRKSEIGKGRYTPTSTIYNASEVGEGLSDKLTSGHFDLSKSSGKSKETLPHGRHDARRGQPGVRELGHHKTGEYSFMKL